RSQVAVGGSEAPYVNHRIRGGTVLLESSSISFFILLPLPNHRGAPPILLRRIVPEAPFCPPLQRLCVRAQLTHGFIGFPRDNADGPVISAQHFSDSQENVLGTVEVAGEVGGIKNG